MLRSAITGEGPAYKLRLFKVKGVNKPEDATNINKFLPGTELVYPEKKIQNHWSGSELAGAVISVVVVVPSCELSDFIVYGSVNAFFDLAMNSFNSLINSSRG